MFDQMKPAYIVLIISGCLMKHCLSLCLDTLTKKVEKKGYKFKYRAAIGRVDAILKTKWGYYQGGADPRGDDVALGW